MTANAMSPNDQLLRQGFKYVNRFMLLMWRLGLGRLLNAWPDVGGQIMVITHTGRKSGLKRRTPVNYALVDGDVYCTAGFGQETHWYKNIMANPTVELWLPDGRWMGVAEDATDDARRLVMLRAVLIASGFAASTFEGISPRTISDDDLIALTQDYRLVRIRRTERAVGPGGPGDLAWLWPLGVVILLLALLRRNKAAA